MDWLDLLAVQGTLKNLLQHDSSKASILWCSAFFTVQLLHPYITTGKTTALSRWTFVGKVMSLLFNMLSRLVITFLPRSKRLLISWLQSPSAVILEPPKIKQCYYHRSFPPPSSPLTVSHLLPLSCNAPGCLLPLCFCMCSVLFLGCSSYIWPAAYPLSLPKPSSYSPRLLLLPTSKPSLSPLPKEDSIVLWGSRTCQASICISILVTLSPLHWTLRYWRSTSVCWTKSPIKI